MKLMTSNELRQAFLDYFNDRGHEVVSSSPLVPGNDPTLLFTNAGMVQFKDVFLGKDRRNYQRAVTSQRCVRAGGKHNDLENVGYTARHHTFFEMLGNFSFGDYFKEDAIRFAWEFLTEVLELPAEKLWVTVYEDDDDAADIWLKTMKVDPKRFSRMGEKDNFWSMGDTGPCGPCSEIFFDHGPDVAGGPPGSPDEDGDRYVEIWNLVFMQFDRSADGVLSPLPKPSVDTGMGLERIAAVMQGVHSNYQIDLFANLINATAKVLGVKNDGTSSLNVIADHIRACSFLIVDGVLPGNEGRGYVLRRIARRAIRHGKKLGMDEPFFYKLVAPLCAEMGEAYPELVKSQAHVEKVLRKEELRFAETLHQGMEILEDAIAKLGGSTELPGELVFKLYDTYGFPIDLTADIARERELTVDTAGFEKAMEKQRQQSQAASSFSAAAESGVETDIETEFSGYEHIEAKGKVVALFADGDAVEELTDGAQGAVVLDTTPFYAESGGQVGDTGSLVAGDVRFSVADTQKSSAANVHYGELSGGSLKVGDSVQAMVDGERRRAVVLNHSATHLMHAALREVLGEHVAQKGSLVAPDRLRFDFSHYEPVTADQLADIEAFVNTEIRRNSAALIRHMSYDDAVESGAIALFGEKYGDEVRVLKLGERSVELCGGTHVERTGDIGLFKIVSESGIASGVRRIEAVTGDGALAWVDERLRALDSAAAQLKSNPDQLSQRIDQLVKRSRELERDLATARQQLLTGGGRAEDDVQEVSGIKVLVSRMDGADAKTLRDAVDRFKDRLGNAVVVLGSVDDGKVRLAAGVTRNNTDKLDAGRIIRPVAEQVGGRGGGRADFAQAGGSDPSALDAALASVPELVSNCLN